ncbi:15987_t:CDS:1 [Dentiscutata erythropus]|uniref:15987_t:CDS:1 n=1 Tax=Dentiscutata erythropus TaxID=1348616 RepID=A0A9N9CUJ9_9GLOM|nr:15987_t:CDS:1 [Dentiscutata erythropus]
MQIEICGDDELGDKLDKLETKINEFSEKITENLTAEKQYEFINKCLEEYIKDDGGKFQDIKLTRENIFYFLNNNFNTSNIDLFHTKYKEIYIFFLNNFDIEKNPYYVFYYCKAFLHWITKAYLRHLYNLKHL